MCKRCNKNHPNTNKMDKCMEKICALINDNPNYTPRGSCCGHGVYPLTVVVEDYNRRTGERKFIEWFSGIEIPRTRNFYKKDKCGIFYIPEVVNKKSGLTRIDPYYKVKSVKIVKTREK